MAAVRFLIPELPQCSQEELAAAVRRAMLQATAAAQAAESVKLPQPTELPTGEELAHPPSHQDTRVDRALALLEGAYLVAASDGLEPSERDALGVLIARVLGENKTDAVTVMLESFDALLAKEGMAARVESLSQRFVDRGERESALGFATLLALADRRLASAEEQALIALGAALGFSGIEVQMVVHKVALRLEDALAAVAHSG